MKLRIRHKTCSLAVLFALTALAGCRTTAHVAREPAPALDRCAQRLHTISERLLLHFAAHGELPESLERSDSVGGTGQELTYVCPVSGESYFYDAGALSAPGLEGKFAVYDATPAHNGGRWAITLSRSAPKGPIIANVVWVSERDVPPRSPAVSGKDNAGAP
ncbi:MAG: hypothetical protein ACYTAN_01995 [Planctomycetota bacterium]|jgi:hypothetical protein